MIAIVLMLLAAPFSASAEIVEGRGYLVVNQHRGGNVVDMIRTRAKLQNSGRKVWIRGYCRSACTMLVTMPNACLGPMATLGFHAPRIPNTSIIPPYVPEIMASYYRNGILKRWNEEWRYSIDMVKISAKDYVKLDPATKLCPAGFDPLAR
ncbi:hypothetical protein [Paracoccus albus]|uniref:hypothetical protein n=1 Tax=Paracoccus albus TaxID=3017784 RepID=UPI0022F00ACB|nr:hypothetical protein [Paracoccus albus]WBU60106.1 hypothetical protein PAF20_15410 [Paracoccus albus]